MTYSNTVEKCIELPNDKLLTQIRQVIREGHTATITVKGNSMRPFLESCRDKVTLTSTNHLNCGDIALAEIRPGIFVLHRIISIKENRVTLMGDGNCKGVESCNLEDIAGVVKIFIRNGKHINANNKTWIMYASLWKYLKPIRRYLLYIYRTLQSHNNT